MICNYVKTNDYRDSVFLMGLGRRLGQVPGLERVAVLMATPMNLSLLDDMGVLGPAGKAAGPNDLIIAMSVTDEETGKKVKARLDALLNEKKPQQKGSGACRDIASALRQLPGADLVVISLPGEFAVVEAEKALNAGLNVFMFSDNVAIEDERKLKQMARDKNLLMMGPGCGLSFLNGNAIGLCSKVRRGPIGLAAASGSGLQETMVLIDRFGSGVSQAIGVGGRDLGDEIGGITMLQAIDILEADADTKVIVVISKPPGKNTERKIMDRLRTCSKPVMVNFINGDKEAIVQAGAVATETFAETALAAISRLALPVATKTVDITAVELSAIAAREVGRYAPEQRYLRGIYCGGTLAEEAMLIMRRSIGEIYANAPLSPDMLLANPQISREHCVIDIGAEEFTRGKPHAAIDPSPRLDRFRTEAADPAVALILMDFLLGYSCNPDPAGMMAETIAEAIATAERAGRHLSVVASICGSELDPQGFSAQKAKLSAAGVMVMPSNSAAARLAAAIIAMKNGVAGGRK